MEKGQEEFRKCQEQQKILQEALELEKIYSEAKAKVKELFAKMDTETYIRFGEQAGYLEQDQMEELCGRIDSEQKG